jgi:hypothetical protein
MKPPSLIPACLLAAFLLVPARAGPLLPWNQGDPTAEEQQAMEWLNAARRDPAGTLGQILDQSGADPVITGFMLAVSPETAAQIEATVLAEAQAARADSLLYPSSAATSSAPLAFYPLFQQQAQVQGLGANPPPTNFPPQRLPPAYIYPVPLFGAALLSGPAGVFSGPNATGGTADFGPYGADYADVSQANLYAPYIGPREWMLTQLTGSPASWSPPPDFLTQGDPLPGLSLGHTRLAGIDISAGASGNRILTLFKGSSEFFTQSDLPFGNANTVFITGVAYRDANSNGIYDPGEGIGGVTVTPGQGNWYAITSASGGYAIPVPANSGLVALTANGGPFAGAGVSVTVGTDNVKADWVVPAGAAALPAQTTLGPPDGSTRLVGLSTRGLVQTGQNTLIGGFVIAGPPGSQKTVLIRGVGPSLQATGFPAAACIPATQLQLCDGTTAVIASNAGWTTAADGGAAVAAAAAQCGDFPLVKWTGGGGDSALVATIPPGSYTVVVSPAPGLPAEYQSGRIGLVEVYDLSLTDGARFVNLSTRGLAGPGNAQLILGCTVAGSGHERVLIRAVGPGLGQFGIGPALPNPVLTLCGNDGSPIAANDDWSDSSQTEQIRSLAAACGAFTLPEGSVDASLLALVAPGNTTSVVGGKPGTGQSGLALVELYETP